MKKVYVSHSAFDQDAKYILEKLRFRLENFGIDVYGLDLEIPSGDYFQRSITENIDRCNLFICFFEPQNANITFELGYALGKNKQILLVGDYREVPTDLKGMVYLSKSLEAYELESRIFQMIHDYEEPIQPPLVDPDDNAIQIVRKIVDSLDSIDQIDPIQFENIIADWFRLRGYNVQLTGIRPDHGYDLIVEPFLGGPAVVEVKRYKPKSQVSVSVVRQLAGAMMLEHINCGIVISTAPFTNSAKYFAKSVEKKLFLWTIQDLLKMEKLPNEAIERNLD